ncbi:CBS domain-containing protein [Streptomyces sp. WAC 00631]|uniref:CBS domain-containing protein n=1 Tax=unclassified Streptomyces TaxID=2593676 RepID=UPI000F7889E2|nr:MULTISPECIES: CBS domain-containing protein [unclassified Streptomyces]MCC5036967.1 CBS domain-containing protein [Streptomyces sp. WAC 00631]MCC9737899.1 CBS domain-containing protein [Streptomyces sp. MNU89]
MPTETPHIVSDVMTQTVVAIGRGASFKEIVRMLTEWKVSAMPVLAGESRVVGVVSEADLLPKEEFRDSDPSRREQMLRLPDLAKAGATTAEELMSAPPVTVRADATLSEAARLMAVEHVKRLPVVDADGRLQGLVSRADLLKVFLRKDEEIAEEVRRTVTSYLFPDPAAPVRVSVKDGVVTLSGRIRDPSLVPVAARLARAVEGVVGVECELNRAVTGPEG